jgi:hypothetical protein
MMQLKAQKVSSYKLSASGDKTEALPALLKLSVGDSHLDSIGDFHIVGEITNQGIKKLHLSKYLEHFIIAATQ